MTEAFKAMMAESKKEAVVEKATLSTEASDSTKSLKMEVVADVDTRQLKVVAEDGDSDDPDMMPVVKDVDTKSDGAKDRKNEKTSLDSAKRLVVVADENVTSNKIPVSKKSVSEKTSEKSTNTTGSARESESTDGKKSTNTKGSQIVAAEVDRHVVTKAVPTQEKESSKEELQTSESEPDKSNKSTEEAPVTKAEPKVSSVVSQVATQTKKIDLKQSPARKTTKNLETVQCQSIAKKERKADDESEKSNKPVKRGENGDESELAKAVRAALLGKQRRDAKAKTQSRPPPWGNFNPYAAGPWPEHPGAPVYPYASQPPPHYGMPPPSGPGGRFSSAPPPPLPFGHPPHSRPPVLPMMTHMEQYASTFFPGYPPHVQQLLARQASRAMGLRSHYTEVVHRDDPPLSGPPPPHAYPPEMGPGPGYAPPHPPVPPPHTRAHHGHDGHPHGPPPPPPGYLGNPHHHQRDVYHHPLLPMVRHPSRGMPKYHRFGKKPMRAPMSMRDEDAELRFVMSRLAPPNRAKTPMRMTSESHHHPLLSPNAPEFTPHQAGSTRGERAPNPRNRPPAPRPPVVDLPPEKRSSRPQDPPNTDAGERRFRSPAQTSVFAPCGKLQPKESTTCGKATGNGKSLSPTSPEFVPIPKIQGHDVSKANAVQTVMKIAQERANHDNQFPQEPMKRDLQTPVHERMPKKEPQRPQPYDHPPKNPMTRAKGPPPSRGHASHFNEVHRSMDAMSPYLPPPGFGHLRGARVTPDMSRYCSPSLRSMTVNENRELNRFKLSPLSFEKRYRSGDRYGNWRGGPRVVKDHGAERIQEVIDARQMAHHQGAPSLRDITNTTSNGMGKDSAANMKSAVLTSREEEMISRFDNDSPPPFMKKNPTSYLEAVSNKSRFGGPAASNPPAEHPEERPDQQQNIIALAEQNINRAQKENLPPSNTLPPSEHTHALGHAPPLTQERRRVTYKEPPRPTLRDLSREARARHERSPENVHSHRDNDNMYVRTGAPRRMMREVQNLPMPSPSPPPGLPIPLQARKSAAQNCENRAPTPRDHAQAPKLGAAAGSLEPTDREENGMQARRMMPPMEHALPEVPMQIPPRERRDNHHVRETYKQAQHSHHFTPRSREIRIRDRIATAEQERRDAALHELEERGHSPRSVQDVRERSSGERFAREENRGRSRGREPDISHLCEQYAIRNECRYGVDTCRYEHVKARDLTDAELDAIYERRREKKAERKRDLEKHRYADHDRYANQREERTRRSRSPSYEDDDRRGPSRRSMRSPRDRYDDRDHRACYDDTDTPARPRGTAYPTSASSNGGSRNSRDHQRPIPRSNRRDRDDRGPLRPTVRGTARVHRDRDRDYQQDRKTHRDHQRSQTDRNRDISRARSRASDSNKPTVQDVRASSQKKDQNENQSPENTREDGDELDATSKKEKREPSREGALTDIRLAPRENKDEVCRFFGTEKPCWAGARCPFSHIGKDGTIIATAKTTNASENSSARSEKAENGVRKVTHESNDAIGSDKALNKTVPPPGAGALKNAVSSARVSSDAEKTAENSSENTKAKYSDIAAAGQQK